MKTVRVKNGTVMEIIPEYALPVDKWYGDYFASQCMEAPEDVEQGWIYDGSKFHKPEPEPEPEPETGDAEARLKTVEAELSALQAAIVKGVGL